MQANVLAIAVVMVVAVSFYALLSGGAGEALTRTLVESDRPRLSAATSTPAPIEPRLPPFVTATPVQERLEPVSTEENRADCGAIRGTAYRSDQERSWYLENCVKSQNRADCDKIRGTPYLSQTERNWYLTTCVR